MGCFITFEGIEGCGKTTQLRLLAGHLEQRGMTVQVSREPGGCPIADQVRSILLDAANRTMEPMAELFLYAAARAQHVAEIIRPALEAGTIVLCDRFTDATIAYQGYGRGLSHSAIVELNRLATHGIGPDITVLLDCPVETGLERAFARINSSRGAREERFELEAAEFHLRVREGYLRLARQEPDRFIVVNAAGDVAEVEEAVRKAVIARLTGA
jgi:dTMP kinase